MCVYVCVRARAGIKGLGTRLCFIPKGKHIQNLIASVLLLAQSSSLLGLSFPTYKLAIPKGKKKKNLSHSPSNVSGEEEHWRGRWCRFKLSQE